MEWDASFDVPVTPPHPNGGRKTGPQRPNIRVKCAGSTAFNTFKISFIWAADPGHYVTHRVVVPKDKPVPAVPGVIMRDSRYCNLTEEGYNLLRAHWTYSASPSVLPKFV